MNNSNYYWWKKPKGKVHESVFQYIAFLRRNQDYRHNSNRKYMRLYSNYDILDIQTYNYFRDETSSAIQNRVTLNVVQSMIDTVTAKITKSKPKPSFLTEAGDYSLQQKAKNLTQFVSGQFYSTEFYDKSAQAFRDSCIFGTGAVKIFARDGKMHAERVFIDEITIDDTDSLYGNPRQMHQIKQIHKDVLKDMYPDATTEIDAISSGQLKYEQNDFNMYNNNTDMIWVVESWHLPSGPNAKDGKHAITIQNKTLFEEDWNKHYFPFVFWRWGQRPIGFFGQGIAEQLQGLQLEINKILRTIQVSMHLVSIPKIYLEASSKVVTAHLDNKIGGIIRYAGTPPTNGPLANIPPELFSHLDRLYERAYQIIGISELSAQSRKPAGLESGRALREYNDIETERFMDVGIRYEKCFLDAARIYLSEFKHMIEAEGEDGKEVTFKGEEFIKKIKWKDVDMQEDKYTMHIFPTSSLSSSPAGKLQDVQELLQAGFISAEEGRDLLDFPDLKGYYNYANSPVEDIKRTIEQIVDQGKYFSPEPYQDLEYGITKIQQAYLFYRTRDLPEEKLELFRRWIEDAQILLKKANEPELPPEAALPAVPQQDLAVPPAPVPGEAPITEESQLPLPEVPEA